MVSQNTKKLTTMAILSALAIVLVAIIHFPIFPMVPFLEYDPADIPILICGFAFGPMAGIAVTLVASLIQGLTVSAASGVYGIIMHIIATSAFVLTASLIYKNHKTKKAAAVAVVCGVFAMVLVMFPANLFITPVFMGMPRAALWEFMPYILLFNFVKAGINGIVTFFIYKSISRVLHKLDVK